MKLAEEKTTKVKIDSGMDPSQIGLQYYFL